MALDPQVQAVLNLIEESGRPQMHTLNAADARAQFEENVPLLDADPIDLHAVTDFEIPGSEAEIPVRLYRPAARQDGTLPLVVYYHGGGWVIGSRQTHDPICRLLANKVHCLVLSVDYRMAPEHPFPAAVVDAFDALKWAVENTAEQGIDGSRIAVAGDSAGGNLAAVMAHLARDTGLPELALQLLIYPVTSAERRHQSYRDFAEGYVLSQEMMDYFFEAYISDPAQVRDPRLSPLLADNHRGLAATEIIVAGFDPLRDEGIEYAKILAEAGNEVRLTNYAGMVHGFLQMSKMVAASHRLIHQCSEALKQAFAV
jgi:acetyl esterase